MNRQQMIDKLVSHAVNTALSDPDREWLKHIFTDGIHGFGRKSGIELVREMQLRGLMEFGEGDPLDEDEEEDDEFDDDEMLLLQRGAMRRDRAESLEE